MLMTKNPAKKKKVTNISADDSKINPIYLYLIVKNTTFYNSENFGKSVYSCENALSEIIGQYSESLNAFRKLRTKKSSKIKALKTLSQFSRL